MKKERDLFAIVSLLISVSFYIFFAFFDGAVICTDSPSYINMQSSREPLYPVLLAIFRRIFQNFSDNVYLDFIVFFQSILMAISVFVLEEYIRKKMKVSKWCAALILLMPMAVSFLCRFVAKRGSMYSNSILTEGLAIPLYLLFFKFLMEYIFEMSKKSLCWCIILLLLMISTRKQMIFALAMLVIGIAYIAYKTRRVRYGVSITLLSVALIFSANAIFDIGYNYILRGEKVTHSSDVRFIATIAFYTAEREDALSIEDTNIRELFLEIYDSCEEQEYLGHSAGTGWSERVSHFGDYYDRIQIDTMWPQISSYVQKNYECNQAQVSKYEDKIMTEISKDIIPLHIDRVSRVFLDNFLSGLVITVARFHPALICYSVIVYALYIVMLFLVIKTRKEKEVVIFSIAVFIAVIFNVGLVSLVIFCQTRYTIYNMALFYIAFIMMASILLKKNQNIKIEKQEEN